MPTVRKTSPGRVTIHDIGTFARGDEREVSHDTAEYLVQERGDFDRVHSGVDESTGAEDEETSADGSEGEDKAKYESAEGAIADGVCPWCGEEFDGVAQHASSAHPEEYAEYKEADN